MKIQLVLLKVVGMSQEDLASSWWTEIIVKPTSCKEANFSLCDITEIYDKFLVLKFT